MKQMDYRRRAVLARIHQTLDRLYLRQEVDWDYDIRRILDEILQLAMSELEFGQGSTIDRALILTRSDAGAALEIGAGWKVDEDDISFSRTIVEQTMSDGQSVLCEDALNDPRFLSAKSIQDLKVLSLLSVPVKTEQEILGAIYVERRDAVHLFTESDREFLEQFADTIASYIKTALIHQRHVAEIRALKARSREGSSLPEVIGTSEPIRQAIDLVQVAAGIERTVLVTGESGSGKELLARAIHDQGARSKGKFVVVDCAALSETLLESELFGHVKGAFTGAIGDRIGAFEEADGGTLFLDEISDASLAMQQQLRRVLQEGEIRRVGDNGYRKVDVRVICATNRDLQNEIDEKRFLADLHGRIYQFPIRLAPLRERKEDIPLLVDHFVATFGERKNPPVRGVDPDVLAMLIDHDWRANNVRELSNVISLAVDLAPGDSVDSEVMARTFAVRGDSFPVPHTTTPGSSSPTPSHGSIYLSLDGELLRRLLAAVSKETPKEERPYARIHREFSGSVIVECLRHTNWKLRPASRLLGISPVKLRQDFKSWLELLIERVSAAGNGDVVDSVATLLEMPPETLRRKLADLGIESGEREATP